MSEPKVVQGPEDSELRYALRGAYEGPDFPADEVEAGIRARLRDAATAVLYLSPVTQGSVRRPLLLWWAVAASAAALFLGGAATGYGLANRAAAAESYAGGRKV